MLRYFAFVLFAAPTLAQIALPTSGVIDVQKFDPSLGVLRLVYVRAEVDVQGTISLENTSPNPTAPNICYPSAYINADWCPFSLGPWQQGDGLPALGAYDGTTDYAGASGIVVQYGPHWGSAVDNASAGGLPPWNGVYGTNAPFVLDAFTGPGVMHINYDVGAPAFYFQLAPWIDHTETMTGSVTVHVTYTYDPFPAVTCNGSTTTTCPCGVAVNGCPNSADSNGAALTFSGSSHVLSDNFTLTASGMPPSTSALFFQGTNATNVGVVMGDGVRCVGGQLVRLGIKHATAGVATYPGPGDASISIKGSVPVGAYRTYQAWFRDPAPGFCTSATSNLTSAVATVWTP